VRRFPCTEHVGEIITMGFIERLDVRTQKVQGAFGV